MNNESMHQRARRSSAAVIAVIAAVGPLASCGTDTYENGTTRTTTRRTVDNPSERSTTTTTHETHVEDAPRR